MQQVGGGLKGGYNAFYLHGLGSKLFLCKVGEGIVFSIVRIRKGDL